MESTIAIDTILTALYATLDLIPTSAQSRARQVAFPNAMDRNRALLHIKEQALLDGQWRAIIAVANGLTAYRDAQNEGLSPDLADLIRPTIKVPQQTRKRS